MLFAEFQEREAHILLPALASVSAKSSAALQRTFWALRKTSAEAQLNALAMPALEFVSPLVRRCNPPAEAGQSRHLTGRKNEFRRSQNALSQCLALPPASTERFPADRRLRNDP